jgi:hypothetical protein
MLIIVSFYCNLIGLYGLVWIGIFVAVACLIRLLCDRCINSSETFEFLRKENEKSKILLIIQRNLNYYFLQFYSLHTHSSFVVGSSRTYWLHHRIIGHLVGLQISASHLHCALWNFLLMLQSQPSDSFRNCKNKCFHSCGSKQNGYHSFTVSSLFCTCLYSYCVI